MKLNKLEMAKQRGERRRASAVKDVSASVAKLVERQQLIIDKLSEIERTMDRVQGLVDELDNRL